MATAECVICSFRQPKTEKSRSVFHQHFSSRQVRVTMGIKKNKDNPDYLCPTCQISHSSKPDIGLNVCVTDSQLHEFHFPNQGGTVIPPDNSHVDWISIPGASINELCDAWRLDYHREARASRTLLVAGLDLLDRGGDKDMVIDQILGFKENIDAQNKYHDRAIKNQFYVTPLLNPPKFCWFPDNGAEPRQYKNRLVEIAELNEWINQFNCDNSMAKPPSFHTWGTRTSMKVLEDGSRWPLKTHRWNDWCRSERNEAKIHLNDFMKGRMGKAVVKFFEGEKDRRGILD